MSYQFACVVVALICLGLTCGQQYPLNYGAGYQPYPNAFGAALLPPENAEQNNDVIHTSSSNFGTHRPPLSVWSGAPIVVGYEAPAAGADNVGLNYAAASRDYDERTSDQLTPAYLPTNLYNNVRAEEFAQRRRQIEEQTQEQEQAAFVKAANHRYDNEDDIVDNDYYNRQQQMRGLSRGRGDVHGQAALLAASARSDTRQSSNPYTGYGRVDAGSFYEPPLPLYARAHAADSRKFSAHFAEYLRQHPERLQPIYDAANDIKK